MRGKSRSHRCPQRDIIQGVINVTRPGAGAARELTLVRRTGNVSSLLTMIQEMRHYEVTDITASKRR
jgi:hypothetical protein